MAKKLTYVLDNGNARAEMTSIMDMVRRGLPGGPVEVVIGRPTKERSTPANRLMWKLLHDVARQVQWAGTYLPPEDWKDLITALMRGQRMVPGLDGSGLVALGMRTSKMSVSEFSDLIELIYAEGTQRGVKWSADTSTDWSAYREAQ